MAGLRLIRLLQVLNSFIFHLHLRALLFFSPHSFIFSPQFLGGQDGHEGVLTRFTFLRSKPGLRLPRPSSKRPYVQEARSLTSS